MIAVMTPPSLLPQRPRKHMLRVFKKIQNIISIINEEDSVCILTDKKLTNSHRRFSIVMYKMMWVRHYNVIIVHEERDEIQIDRVAEIRESVIKHILTYFGMIYPVRQLLIEC